MSDFDPNAHMSKLARKQRTADGQWKTVELDYLEVKWRLAWLRQDAPDAKLDTHLEKLDDHIAVFRAHVLLPSGAEATGWGSETPDDWKDYIEKAETKAVGRCLAALGFGTQHCADFDFEQGRDDKVVDAPVKRPAPNGAMPVANASQAKAPAAGSSSTGAHDPRTANAYKPVPADGPNVIPAQTATQPQLKAIYAIGHSKGYSDEQIWAACQKRFGKHTDNLSRSEASEAITLLKGDADAAQGN